MTQNRPPYAVSVVLATYNSARDVAHTLESIARQTLDCVQEIVVVDDASTDDSRHVVLQFGDPRIRLVPLESNRGVATARQIGMETARCDWIAFTDADDVWLDDKLERQFAMLERNPDAVACVGGSGRLHRDGRQQWLFKVGRWQWCPEDNPTPASPPTFRPALDGFAYLQSLLVRREIALLEAFKPQLKLMQDQDYMVRLGRHGRFITTEQPVFLYRLGYSNTTAPGNMKARDFLANRDYLYRVVDALASGNSEPDATSFLRDHVASAAEIDAFEFGQQFRYVNTLWVNQGMSAAMFGLAMTFLKYPSSTFRQVYRRILHWRSR